MADRQTVDVYEQHAADWVAARSVDDVDHVAWVDEHRQPGPVVDIGCGPGWHLPMVGQPAIAFDHAAAMLSLVADQAPDALPVRGSVDSLPFASRSLGGALANRVHVHLPASEVPLALADLHRCLKAESPLFMCLFGDELGEEVRSTGQFGGRLFSGWQTDRLLEVCIGAGFAVEQFDRRATEGRAGRLQLRLRRLLTLPDSVGPHMRLLICGLNPSIYSAEVGVGFGRPGNRFWPAALQAGLVTKDRDPRHALINHGIGMTDLAKRSTRRADELDVSEYRDGLQRVERLIRWLEPDAVCFVGLAGWRAVVDRKAVAGRQPERLSGAEVYLMPSTSGLNAHSRLEDLAVHLRSAADLAGLP